MDTNKKKSKNFKIIIAIIVVVIICIIGYAVYYSYMCKKETALFNQKLDKYNSLVITATTPGKNSLSQLKNQSTELNNVSESFNALSSNTYLDKTDKTEASNYKDLALYLSYKQDLGAKLLTILQEEKDIKAPTSKDIQNMINETTALLKNNDYNQMYDLYSTSEYVRKNLNTNYSPEQLHSTVVDLVNALNAANQCIELSNDLKSSFKTA